MSVLPSPVPTDDELDTLMFALEMAQGVAPDRALQRALSVLARTLHATKACIAVFRAPYVPGTGPVWAITVGCDGAGADALGAHFSSTILQRAMAGGRAFSVPSALGDPSLWMHKSVRFSQITSVVCAPLGTTSPAVLCVQNPSRGAYQRLEVSRVEALVHRLSPLLERALQGRDVRRQAFRGLHGRSPQWLECVGQVERLARRSDPVLLVGEPGTGRRSLARAMHAAGARSDGPRCEVKAPQLSASHVREAAGGTLLIEGVEQLTDGGRQVLTDLLGAVDATEGPRVVATCAAGSEAASEGPGGLRDLFIRGVVEVPTLEDRQGDLVALLEPLGRRAAERLELAWHGLTSEAVDRLRRRRWLGNVAEVFAVLSRAVASTHGARPVEADDLVYEVGGPTTLSRDAMSELFPDGFLAWKDAKHRFEVWYLQAALREFDGHRALTASRLGMGRATLFDVLKRGGIDLPDADS